MDEMIEIIFDQLSCHNVHDTKVSSKKESKNVSSLMTESKNARFMSFTSYKLHIWTRAKWLITKMSEIIMSETIWSKKWFWTLWRFEHRCFVHYSFMHFGLDGMTLSFGHFGFRTFCHSEMSIQAKFHLFKWYRHCKTKNVITYTYNTLSYPSDRFFYSTFRPKKFRIKFYPQLLGKFVHKTTNIKFSEFAFWTLIMHFKEGILKSPSGHM
jgi:hypothetical protein